MKFSLGTAIKSACVLATATLTSQAFAQPEIYGQVRLSLSQENVETTDTSTGVKTETDRAQLKSGNSRIGFKGTETLTENVDLKYRLEYRVDVAEKGSSNFDIRHGYLALKHKNMGELLVGRTISYDDNLDVSPAWWQLSGTGNAYGSFSDWVDNSIQYTTPKFNNGRTELVVQYGMDEGDKGRAFDTFKNGDSTEVTRDFFVVGGSHDTGRGSVGFAYTRAGDDYNAISGALSHDITDRVNLALMAQHTDYNSDNNEIAGSVALSFKVTEPLGVWVEGAYADKYKGFANGENTKVSLGTTYDFSKSTMTYASVAYRDTEYDTIKQKGKGVEAGIIYKF